MNALRVLVPATAVAVCLVATSLLPTAVATAQENEIVLRPGEVWRVYDDQDREIGRITVDDVVEGVGVAQYHTTDPATGADSEKLTGIIGEVRTLIATEIAKGVKANRGYFLDADQINFAVAGTVVAEDVAPAEADGESAAPAPSPAPSPGAPQAEAPPAPGAPASAPGPPGAEQGPGAPPGPPAEALEEDEGKGLPLLPILIVVLVVVVVIVVVMLRKRGRGGAPPMVEQPPPSDEPPPPPVEEPPSDSEDTG